MLQDSNKCACRESTDSLAPDLRKVQTYDCMDEFSLGKGNPEARDIL